MDLDIVKKARVVDEVSVNIHVEFFYLNPNIFTYFPTNSRDHPLVSGVSGINGREKRLHYQQ